HASSYFLSSFPTRRSSDLMSLIGTPYMPDIDGGILFLEDISEHPYRIERMLVQLWQAGILGRQKALLLGHFTGYRAGANGTDYSDRKSTRLNSSHVSISYA